MLALLVVGAVLGVTNTDFGRERVRRIAVSAMNKSIHGTTRIGRIDGDLLRGITLYDVSITDSAGAPFFASPMVQARYTIRNFFSKHIIIDALGVDKPQVVLDKKPGAEWNFTTLFASADTTKKDTTRGFGSWITLRNVRLNDGHILVRLPWTPGRLAPQGRARQHRARGARGRCATEGDRSAWRLPKRDGVLHGAGGAAARATRGSGQRDARLPGRVARDDGGDLQSRPSPT